MSDGEGPPQFPGPPVGPANCGGLSEAEIRADERERIARFIEGYLHDDHWNHANLKVARWMAKKVRESTP